MTNNDKAIRELLEYMARVHNELIKNMEDNHAIWCEVWVLRSTLIYAKTIGLVKGIEWTVANSAYYEIKLHIDNDPSDEDTERREIIETAGKFVVTDDGIDFHDVDERGKRKKVTWSHKNGNITILIRDDTQPDDGGTEE